MNPPPPTRRKAIGRAGAGRNIGDLNMTTNSGLSIYEMITEKIISSIEKDQILPWNKPWKLTSDGGGFPRNLLTGNLYRGINCLILGCSDLESPFWITFRQCETLKGRVKKGSKGTPIVYWQILESKEGDSDPKKKRYPLIKYSTVFNSDQCEGLNIPPVKWSDLTPDETNSRCKTLVDGYSNRPTIKAGFGRAVYSVSQDEIRIPSHSLFTSVEEYFCTLFHELIHSTGHAKRLGRFVTSKEDSSEQFERYGREELIAEIGASFLCAEAGITPATFDNSVAYLKGWVDSIKANPRAIVEAASHAQKATDLILGKSAEITEPQLEKAA